MHSLLKSSGLRLSLIFILLGSLAFSSIARAEEWEGQDKKHRGNIRGFLLYAIPIGESDAYGRAWGSGACQICAPYAGCMSFSADFSGEGTAETQNALGFMIGFEYLLLNGRLGLEADLAYIMNVVKYELKGDFDNISGIDPGLVPGLGDDGNLNMTIFGLCVNYHFTPRNKLDFYGGPLFAPAVKMTGTDEVEIGKSIAFGLNLGADYRVKRSLIISVNARFIDMGQVKIKEDWYLRLAEDSRYRGMLRRLSAPRRGD